MINVYFGPRIRIPNQGIKKALDPDPGPAALVSLLILLNY